MGGGIGSSIHRDAFQTGLIGIDISPIAIHLTAASLVQMGNTYPYGNTQMSWVKVGTDEGFTGSLEYLDEREKPDMFGKFKSKYGVAQGVINRDQDDVNKVVVGKSSVDWVLMNPPYTRSTGGKHGLFDLKHISSHERQLCQEKCGLINRMYTINSKPIANKKAGLGSSFLVLSREKLKHYGKMGFVLPLTFATAESWTNSRAMIELEFSNIIALTTLNGNMSADTGIKEMLLVATREKPDMDPSRGNNKNIIKKRHEGGIKIHCVNLKESISETGIASVVADQIIKETLKDCKFNTIRPIKIGEQEVGNMFLFQGSGYGSPWYPLGADNISLISVAQRLLNGTISFSGESISIDLPMCSLGNVLQVGVGEDSIGHKPNSKSPRGVFELHRISDHDETSMYEDLSLWEVNSKTQKSIVVKPSHKAVPSPEMNKSEVDRNKIRKYKSNLFYSNAINWNSNALLCAMTESKVHGGRSWRALSHEKSSLLPMFALWLNSTFGLLIQWTQGQKQQPGRSVIRTKAIHKVPIPNFNKLSEIQILKAQRYFEDIKNKTLKSSIQVVNDPVRIEIDNAVVDILKLPNRVSSILEIVRKMWSEETSLRSKS